MAGGGGLPGSYGVWDCARDYKLVWGGKLCGVGFEEPGLRHEISDFDGWFGFLEVISVPSTFAYIAPAVTAFRH